MIISCPYCPNILSQENSLKVFWIVKNVQCEYSALLLKYIHTYEQFGKDYYAFKCCDINFSELITELNFSAINYITELIYPFLEHSHAFK